MNNLEFHPLVVSTTSDRKEVLDLLANELVKRKLAACVQVFGPIESHYQWQGQLESSQEWTCWIKTSRDKYELVEKCVMKLHNYDMPQIVAWEIVAGSLSYFNWMVESMQ